MKTIRDLLAEHPFFKDLTDDQIDLLAGCGKNVTFKEGDNIAHEGQDADYFYVLRRGKVALQMDAAQHGKITIQTVGAGEVLGFSWLVPPHKWRFNLKALEETGAVALDGVCLRGKCQDDHELGYALLSRFSTVLVKRLENTRIQLLDIYGIH